MTSPRLLAAVPLFVLASCVPAPKPVAAPPPVIAPPAPAIASADWRDGLATPGGWTYRDGVSRFAVAGAAPSFELRCDPATRVVVLAMAGSAGPLTVTASDATRALATTDQAGFAVASLAARDPLLDALAFSRGRILVTLGTTRLVLPAWAEIGRVVEDCRG